MSIRYTDLCKQMQKTAAVLLSSSVILQGCSGELSNHNMKGGSNKGSTNKLEVNSVSLDENVRAGDNTLADMESSRASTSGKLGASRSSAPSSKWVIAGAFGAGVLVAGTIVGASLGATLAHRNDDLNNANNQNSALQAQLDALNSTNSALSSQMSALQSTLNTYSPPVDALVKTIQDSASSVGSSYTISNSTGSRLLTEIEGDTRLLTNVPAGNLSSVSDLGKVTAVSILDVPIFPYTSQGVNILSSISAAMNGTSCANTASNTAPIINAVATSLTQSDPASIAATAASTVTYASAGTPAAISNAIRAVIPTSAQTTDPGYLAAQAASQLPGATINTVLLAVVNANGNNNAPSSIAAAAAARITKASSYATYPFADMTPTPSAIANSISVAVPDLRGARMSASTAVASITTTATPTTILAAVNAALGNNKSWFEYGFSFLPTTNQDVIDGFSQKYGSGSVHASIASAMSAVGPVSPLGFSAPNLLSAINYATSNPQSTSWVTYTGSSTPPANYGAATNAITNYGSAYTAIANAVVAGMSTVSPSPLASTVSSAIVASNPVSIDATQASLVPGATCTTVSTAVRISVSENCAAYSQPSAYQIYELAKFVEYVPKYFKSLSTIVITGKSLTVPATIDWSPLPKLSSVSLNGSVVESQIVLNKDLSNLAIINSTKCAGSMIISNTPGANFSSPGFTNTTVNTAATAFNMQSGISPLCPGNDDSIPTGGLLPIVSEYVRKYGECKSNLETFVQERGVMKGEFYNALSTAINVTNELLETDANYNNCKATLTNCTSTFSPYITNKNTLGLITAQSCTLTN